MYVHMSYRSRSNCQFCFFLTKVCLCFKMFQVKTLFCFLLVLTVLTHNSSQYGTYLPLRTNGRQAVCVLQAASTSAVAGEIRLFQKTDYDPVEVMGHIQNLAPGAHGFHLHSEGSLADDCKGAGSHFNPLNQPHGGPQDLHRHAGDFGNILADENGQAVFHLMNDQVSLVPGSQFYGVGRAFVVHEKQDDLGRGGNPESLKTGNAGSRLACCVVQPVGY